ncbi:hypothetical protein Pcinc_004686 [Petrolisthes cinctipes]|uniref:Uncharacterized protein n=1 Tax=Petrolisthes cinctipes TaxID=88211 RepID=A0AAE1GEY5_PETCI|nr:hypothetical protein Pcinc_004686 [Petrolisthes cinctipes]
MKRKRVLPLTSEFCKDPQPLSNLLASRHKFAPHSIDGVGCLCSLVPARKSGTPRHSCGDVMEEMLKFVIEHRVEGKDRLTDIMASRQEARSVATEVHNFWLA